MPSGNAVAVEALQTLATISGDMRLHTAAERALQAAWHPIEQAPYAHVGLLEALRGTLDPGELIIIRGPEDQMDSWRARIAEDYRPARRCFTIPTDATDLPAALADKQAKPGRTRAYRCRGFHCEPPIEDLEDL
jgi:hypothetical protein